MSETTGVTPEPTDAARDAVDGPYIGLRPFRESQRDLIFGRDRDAQLLRQKLYSSRLTLLYAPSGVGKTSLLSALVIPSLERHRDEEEGSLVASFEQWQAADPLAALKARIASVAGTTARPADELAQILAAAQQAHGYSVVLVLDQFEQLLIRHPEKVDAIGRELGHAVQLAARCHIVVSLREEFLASLHPLREHIPALMSSTYRLEHLAGQSARAAITEPAARFKAEVEPALLDTLIDDLRADVRGAAGVLTVPPPGAVELPFLQLICKALWERSDRHLLTLDLYRVKLGGRGGIIQIYLNEVVAGLSPIDRDHAANILHRLAPQSGVKKLYLADELASETGLPATVVGRLLEHFAQHSVLRTRDTGGATGYELHHDAFTAVLRPWIDARLTAAARRKRAWRRVRVGAAVLLAAGLAAVFIWPMVQARARVNNSVTRATESFTGGQETAAQAEWTNLAGYLIGRNEPDVLIGLLRTNRQFVPRRGTSTEIAEALPEALVAEQTIGESEASPTAPNAASVLLTFGAERRLDLVGLHYAWRVGASRLLSTMGLPVPIRIRVDSGDLQIDRMRMTIGQPKGPAREVPTLLVPSRPDHIVLLANDLRLKNAKDALAALRRASPTDVEDVRSNGAQVLGWYVPYWTTPLWSALGVQTWPEEFGVAIAVSAHVLAEPGVLLDVETVRFLLNRTRAARFCETVAEAEAARGGVEGVRRDLIALLKTGRSIGDLPDVLDALAAFPSTEGSDSVARAVAGDSAAKPRLPMPRTKHVMRVNTCTSTEMASPNVPERFHDLLFPPIKTQVQVTFGAELARSVDGAWTRNRRAYQQMATDIRKKMYTEFGVDPPEVAPPAVDRELASRQFSILLPGRARQRQTAVVPPDVPPDGITGVVAPLLQAEMDGNVSSFIKAEAVARALAELPSGVRTWLRQTYSLTDLKTLMRDVVGNGRPEQPAQSAERTLSQLPWLLGSLTFWTSACEPRDQTCLVAGLVSAQRARIAAAARHGEPSGRADDDKMSAGILQLLQGEMAKAEATFRTAIRKGPPAAADAFVTQWAQWARPIQGYQLKPACQQPTPAANWIPEVPLHSAWDIEDYLDKRQPGVGDEEDRLAFGLCLIQAHVSNGDHAGSEAAWQRITRDAGNLEGWGNPTTQFLAGQLLFNAVRQEIVDDKYLADSQRLLAAALSKLRDDERLRKFEGLVGVCDNWHTPRCMAHMQAIEAAVPGSFHLPLHLGVSLSGSAANKADAEAALRLLAKAEARFPKTSKAEEARLRALMLRGRADAFFELAREHPDQLHTSRDSYRALLKVVPKSEPAGWPSREDAYYALLLLDVFEGHLENAQRVLEEWHKESGETVAFRFARAFLMLERSDTDGLKSYAHQVASEALEADTSVLLVASIAAILSNSLDASTEAMTRRFFASDHVGRYGVRLLLYWRLETQGQHESAKALIDGQWSRLDAGSWTRRLERGELDPWQEMLIAYYHGSLQRAQIFEGLEDEAHYRASAIGRSNRPYATVLSEAHFYDALLQGTVGESATRKSRMTHALEQVVALRDVRIWEYSIARYLLRSME